MSYVLGVTFVKLIFGFCCSFVRLFVFFNFFAAGTARHVFQTNKLTQMMKKLFLFLSFAFFSFLFLLFKQTLQPCSTAGPSLRPRDLQNRVLLRRTNDADPTKPYLTKSPKARTNSDPTDPLLRCDPSILPSIPFLPSKPWWPRT